METVHPEPPLKDMTPLICYCDVCECVTVDEAKEKLSRGLYILIREATFEIVSS